MAISNLNEGIYFKDNSFVFDFMIDNKLHFINLKFPKDYLKQNKDGVYYSYVFKKDVIDNNIKHKFLYALKYKDSLIDPIDYDRFISKAIIGLYKTVGANIDAIIYPSSSSTINYDIAKKLQEKIGYNCKLLTNVIAKNSIENIQIDDKMMSPKTILSYKSKLSKNGKLIMKDILPMHRKFFSNFLKLNDVSRTTLNLLKGNVLLIDDYLTKGITMIEMERLLKSYGNENLYKYVLIKI